MKHRITADHRVVTIGSAGQVIAVTTWPDHTTALAYAQRLASFVGGHIHETAA